MKKDPNVGIPIIPRLLTMGLLLLIAYIYITDLKKENDIKPAKSQTATIQYLFEDDQTKQIEFIDGKTTISLNKIDAEKLSQHLEQAFEGEIGVFEIELDKYEPGNDIPQED